MTTITNNLSRKATTAFAALVMTTTCFTVATNPARAATSADFKQLVERQIDAKLRFPNGARPGSSGIATVAVQVDSNGRIMNTTLVRGTGQTVFDREAVRTASAIDYPATGKPRTLAMVLRFGSGMVMPSAADSRALVAGYTNAKGEALASDTAAAASG